MQKRLFPFEKSLKDVKSGEKASDLQGLQSPLSPEPSFSVAGPAGGTLRKGLHIYRGEEPWLSGQT